MKKQSLITLVTALFAVLTLTAFYACSADEGAPEAAQPTTKADILRAKAKEFAKKYGVNMTLNEDKIDSLAQILTVEQMEEDFKNISTQGFKSSSTLCITPKSPNRRRIKVRRSKILEESDGMIKGEATADEGLGTCTLINNGKSYKMGVSVSWDFSRYSNNHVLATATCGNYRGSATLASTNVSYNPDFSFSASGEITLTGGWYIISGHIDLDYNGLTQRLHATLVCSRR